FQRRLNSQTYVEILNNYLLPGVNARYPGNEPVYVIEDNSPIHTAVVVREWYAAHPKLQRLNHPSRSADLNYIENMWDRMTREWVPQAAPNNENLDRRVRQSWEALLEQPQYFQNLATSMGRRLQKVIDANGTYIHY
ncbi:hypothetical protein TSAR_001671, partial [Trichomalopsis sarcophagae]